MTSRIPIKKVYIDSRFKTANSASNSDFKFELKESISLPDKVVMYIDDVIVPVSWFNIDDNNKYLYIRRFEDLTTTTTDVRITLATSNHTADTMLEALQTALDAGFGADVFTATYDERKLTYTITPEPQSEIKVFTDAELLLGAVGCGWEGDAYDVNNINTANEVFGIYTSSGAFTLANFETSIIDLRRYHNIYISSPNLSSFSTLGPQGQCNIIKKIPVSSEYGFTIIDNVIAPHDWIDVSKQLLKTLEFRLSDAYGKTINLRGMPISFSLIFMSQDD